MLGMGMRVEIQKDFELEGGYGVEIGMISSWIRGWLLL